ncbi:7037_t:CDS:2 [Diversispora eburnea]|uniref:7037_t:CDS:1 n=1 Tax=Diversispora eburnea TaxID=1213867 RepID=A0A9N9B6N9_9GLOM|nr:7037_t:CDS:2 [Diversispora eburnea]
MDPEPVHNEEYLNWLHKYIPLTVHLVWHYVGNNYHLLNYVSLRLPFIIHGGTDMVVVNDFDVDTNMIPEGIHAVLNLKIKIERNHIMQVIFEIVAADLLVSEDKEVFGILSNLIDDWYILWIEDNSIKNWKVSSRNIAVEVMNKLLGGDFGDSSGVNTKGTSIIIPGFNRVKFKTLLSDHFTLEERIYLDSVKDSYSNT